MNAESSRSHLVLSVIIEATNKTNGQVNRGKVRYEEAITVIWKSLNQFSKVQSMNANRLA